MIRKSHVRFEYALMLAVTLIFYALSYNLGISQLEGFLLFSAFVAFNIYLFKGIGKGTNQETEQAQEGGGCAAPRETR